MSLETMNLHGTEKQKILLIIDFSIKLSIFFPFANFDKIRTESCSGRRKLYFHKVSSHLNHFEIFYDFWFALCNTGHLFTASKHYLEHGLRRFLLLQFVANFLGFNLVTNSSEMTGPLEVRNALEQVLLYCIFDHARETLRDIFLRVQPDAGIVLFCREDHEDSVHMWNHVFRNMFEVAISRRKQTTVWGVLSAMNAIFDMTICVHNVFRVMRDVALILRNICCFDC